MVKNCLFFFLFTTKKDTEFAPLLRSNVKTACGWGTTKGVLAVTEYSGVTWNNTHWKGINSRAFSPTRSWFFFHGQDPGMGPEIMKQNISHLMMANFVFLQYTVVYVTSLVAQTVKNLPAMQEIWV